VRIRREREMSRSELEGIRVEKRGEHKRG